MLPIETQTNVAEFMTGHEGVRIAQRPGGGEAPEPTVGLLVGVGFRRQI